MKIEWTLLVTGLLIAGSWSARAQSTQSAQNQPAVSITIHAVKDTVQAGAPVEVQATIRNDSNIRVPYDMSGWNEYHAFDVRDSAGKEPLTRRGRAMLLGEGAGSDDLERGGGPVGFVEPGQTLTITIRVPAQVFDLTHPGTYSIQFRLPWKDRSLIKSNTATVIVVEGPTPYVPPVLQPPISVTIQPAGGVLTFPSNRVAVEVITKNISNHWINERTSRNKTSLQRFFRVDVRDSQGATPPETDLGRSVGNRVEVPPKSAAGLADPGRDDEAGRTYNLAEERVQAISVSDLYDLSKPGQYTIQVRRWDDETKTWVKSNTITVTVTP